MDPEELKPGVLAWCTATVDDAGVQVLGEVVVHRAPWPCIFNQKGELEKIEPRYVHRHVRGKCSPMALVEVPGPDPEAWVVAVQPTHPTLRESFYFVLSTQLRGIV